MEDIDHAALIASIISDTPRSRPLGLGRRLELSPNRRRPSILCSRWPVAPAAETVALPPARDPTISERVLRAVGGLGRTIDQPLSLFLLLIHTRSASISLRAVHAGASHDLLRLLAKGATVTKAGELIVVSYHGSTLYLSNPRQLPYRSASTHFIPLIKSGWSAVDSPDADEVLMRGPKELRFALAKDNLASGISMLHRRFIENEYDLLDVRGCQVLDIGSNIGDSAVAFARRGAAKVYSFQPLRTSFDQTVRNVGLCGHGNVVRLFHNAVSGSRGRRNSAGDPIPPIENHPYGKWASALHRGEPADVLTLMEALAKCRDELPIVCRLDCEGAEFDIFESDDIGECLDQIDRLVIEYHGQEYPRILEPLTTAGFTTWREERGPDIGLIVASRDQDRASLEVATA